jgi:hypothetical protein
MAEQELREQIARIIDPNAFCVALPAHVRPRMAERRQGALAKADQIIALLPKDEWRTMESAPRDQPIMVFAPGEDPRWSPALSDLISICQWHPDAGFCVCELRDPTHWRPLPAPPTLISQQEAERD